MKKNFTPFLLAFLICNLAYAQIQTIDAGRSKKSKEGQGYTFIFVKEGADISIASASMWLRKSLDCRPEDSFRESRRYTDKSGQTHIRFRQFYKGLPVFPGEYIVHNSNGRIISANGDFFENVEVEVQSAISAVTARQLSIDYLKTEKLMTGTNPDPELIVFAYQSQPRLAYRTEVYSKSPLAHYRIFLDANTGEIFMAENLDENIDVPATAYTRYSGQRTITTNGYSLEESGRNITTRSLEGSTDHSDAVQIYDSNNIWDDTVSVTGYGADIHFGLEVTYDYFLNTHGWNSFDNAGHIINAYVNYSSGYNNAFWNGSQLTFGDGDGINYNSFASVDVAAHEFTHGVVDYSANLIGFSEPGALNESFSDIFGITINFLTNATTASYRVGSRFAVSGLPFRDMSNPKNCGHPDTYHGEYWDYNGGGWFGGGEVHIDAGPSNYSFYLLTEGGWGTNDNGDAYFVSGIGRDKAADIAFRALTVYLTIASNYSDCRNAIIQSAIDLHGSCSNEVIQATNAWYAIGVGAQFSSVQAGFSVSRNVFCQTPAQVTFANHSINAQTYLWDFGDGTQSNQSNPLHVYALPGTYTAQLTVTGSGSCATTSVYSLPLQIQSGGLSSVPCIPLAQTPCCLAGIYSVRLNDLYYLSGNSQEGYKDFSCEQTAHVIAGESYRMTIYTGKYMNEYLKAWIDYDNNGQFTADELMFDSPNRLRLHDSSIIIPPNAVVNIPLRMRIISDIEPLTSPCAALFSGQAEDYSVIISPNPLPPVAMFDANVTHVFPGEQVVFTDRSLNTPIARQWYFPGGIADSLNPANPVVTYFNSGIFDAGLTVTNLNGSDSVLKSTYIEVSNRYTICEQAISYSTYGEIENSRGLNGDCYFTIVLPCATDISIHIDQFNFQYGSYLKIYDGVSSAAPLLFSATGSSAPLTLLAHSGKAYFHYRNYTSDTSVYFHATWNMNLPSASITVPPFSISNANVQLNDTIHFQDHSAGGASWKWDFGDGHMSLLQDPSHLYSQPGIYQVTLIVATCSGTDTITQQVSVQQAGNIFVYPISPLNMLCGDSAVVPLMLVNNGAGDLNAGLTLEGTNTMQRVLVLAYGARMQDEVPHALNAVKLMQNIIPVVYGGKDPQILSTLLANCDVILVPGNYNNRPFDYERLAPVIRNFIERGGGIVFLNGSSDYAGNFHSLGLLHPVNYSFASGTVSILTQHPLLDGVPSSFTLPGYTHCLKFLPGEMQTLITKNGCDVLSYRQEVTGRIVFLAFDFYSSGSVDALYGKLLSNALSWAGDMATDPLSLSSPDTSLQLQPGDSIVMSVTVHANEHGHFTRNILINTDLPSTDTVLLEVMVQGNVSVSMPAACLHFGTTTQFSISYDTLFFFNNGCGTLYVDSIINTSGDFEILSFTKRLEAGASGFVVMKFLPVTPGFKSATFQLFSNATPASFCADGTALAAPHLNPIPAFQLNLNCNQSQSYSAAITNTGAVNTLLQTNRHFRYNDSLKVLFLTNGLFNNALTRIDSMIKSQCSDCVVTRSSNNQESALLQLLPQYDVLIISPTSIISGAGISTVVTNFAGNGGNVIYLGWSNPEYYFTANNHLEGLVHGTTIGDTVTITHPAFPAMDSIGPFPVSNFTNVTTLTNQNILRLIDLKGHDYCTYSAFGLGTVYFIAANYAYSGDHDELSVLPQIIRTIRASGLPSWISVPDNFIVSAGSTGSFPITISTSGLAAGTYQEDIILRTVSPNYQFDTIHFNISVTGNESISLSANQISFDTTFAGGFSTRMLILQNTGCDTLFIDSITSAHSSINGNNGFILSHAYDTLFITMQAYGTGQLTDSLRIYNSAIDTTVILSMYGIPAPAISIYPDTFNITLSCGDSLQSSIQINNGGQSSLNYTCNHRSGDDSIQVKILVHPGYLYHYVNYFIPELRANCPEVSVEALTTVNPDTLETQLRYTDVLIVNYNDYYSTGVYAVTDVIREFAERGGTVIFSLETAGNDSLINTTGLLDLHMDGNAGPYTINIPGHPLVVGMHSPISFNYYDYPVAVSNQDFISVVSNGTSQLVGYRKINSGNVVYIGLDNVYVAVPYIYNAIRWFGGISAARWLQTYPPFNQVPAQGSSTVFYSIHVGTLTAGSYTTWLIIESNDPVHPLDSTVVNLTVTGAGELTLTDSCIDMNIVQVNILNTHSFLLTNSGCDTITINGATGMTSGMSLAFPDSTLLPGDTIVARISFIPPALGTFSGMLTITTSAGNFSFCYNAISSPPPVCVSSPATINVNIGCGDSLYIPVTVHNNGGSNLHIVNRSTGRASYIQLLFLTHGVDSGIFIPFITALQNYDPLLQIRYLDTTDTTMLSQNLRNNEIVVAFQTNYFPGFGNSVVLDRFIRNGGKLIVLGGGNNNAGRYTSYLNCDYIFNANGSNAELNVSHPLTDSLISGFLTTGTPVSYENAYFNSVIVDNNYYGTLAGYIGVQSGYAVYLGFDYSYFNQSEFKVFTNAVYWQYELINQTIEITPPQVNISPGDSSVFNVFVTLQAESQGVISDTLIFQTNDPLLPSVTIPVSINVIINPLLVIGDSCLHYGSLPQSAVAMRTTLLTNGGCDTVKVTSITSSSGLFQCNDQLFDILPGMSRSVTVSFSSSQTGNVADTLTISGNFPDRKICLTANVTGAPEVSYNPASFTLSLSCKDTVAIDMTITNTGQGSLDVSHNTVIHGDPNIRLAIISDYYYNPASLINNPNCVIQLYYFYALIPGQLETILKDNDMVFMIPTHSPPVIDSLLLQRFVKRGGTLVFISNSGWNQFGSFGIFHGLFINTDFSQPDVMLPSHPLLNKITLPMNSFYMQAHDFSDPGLDRVIENLSYDVLATRSIGFGTAIYCGIQLDVDSNSGKLINNMISWAGSKSHHRRITSGVHSLSIPAGVTDSLHLFVTAAGLPAGTYTDTLHLYTNDPLQPQILVPFTLNISGGSQYSLSNSCINFGGVSDESTTASLSVINTGCAPLHINGLSLNSNSYTANYDSSVIMPGDSSTININFYISPPAFHSDSMTINTTIGDTAVCLQATILSPLSSLNPKNISVTLGMCHDTVTVPVAIHNGGSGFLNASITDGAERLEVLVLDAGADQGTEFPNVLSVLSQSGFKVTELHSTDTALLKQSLHGRDAIVIAEPETGNAGDFTAMAGILYDFAFAGGEVIFCGSDYTSGQHVFNTGLFHGSYTGNIGGQTVTVSSSDSMANSLPLSFTAPSGTYTLSISDTDKVSVVWQNAKDVACYRNIGAGMAVYLAFDYFIVSYENAKLMSNAVLKKGLFNHHDWLSLMPDSVAVPTNSTDTIHITFSTTTLLFGNHTDTLLVYTNDPFNSIDTVICNLTVNENLCTDFSYVTGCDGMVMFFDSSANNPTAWFWDFGDGDTSWQQHPTHQYASAGPFTVMHVSSNNQESDTVIFTLTPNFVTQAVILYSGLHVPGALLNFYSQVNNGTNYLWNFGDGSQSTLPSDTHTYSMQGIYTVSVQVTDSAGCVSSDSVAIVIVGLSSKVINVEDLKFYPNPSNGRGILTYNLRYPSHVDITVFDPVNKLVSNPVSRHQEPGLQKIDISFASNGMYFIRLKTEDGVAIIRVVNME